MAAVVLLDQSGCDEATTHPTVCTFERADSATKRRWNVANCVVRASSRTGDQASRDHQGRYTWEKQCRKCGAPYKLFSLDRAMFSGLCVNCSPAPKPRSTSVLYEPPPINSREDALKAIRNAAIFYAVLFVFNIYLGANEDPVFYVTALVILTCTFVLCSAHSRIAAVLLLLLAIWAVISMLVIQGMQGLGPVTVIFTVLQFGLTINTLKATFKLQREFKSVNA